MELTRTYPMILKPPIASMNGTSVNAECCKSHPTILPVAPNHFAMINASCTTGTQTSTRRMSRASDEAMEWRGNHEHPMAWRTAGGGTCNVLTAARRRLANVRSFRICRLVTKSNRHRTTVWLSSSVSLRPSINQQFRSISNGSTHELLSVVRPDVKLLRKPCDMNGAQ